MSVLEPLRRLDRDLRSAARLMGRQQARYLVDLYYQVQEFRKASANMHRSIPEDEPCAVLDWVFENTERLESNIKKALGDFAAEWMPGRWMQSLVGIGPVISAGFLAHLDVRLAKTVGHFWRFAGLDPSMKWEKGQKRPWNAKLKTICWHAGQCFMRFSNRDECFYGKHYRSRKEFEVERNEKGGNAVIPMRSLAPGNSTYVTIPAAQLPQ